MTDVHEVYAVKFLSDFHRCFGNIQTRTLIWGINAHDIPSNGHMNTTVIRFVIRIHPSTRAYIHEKSPSLAIKGIQMSSNKNAMHCIHFRADFGFH